MLKGTIDRPEAWAFPVNLLLTALIGPWGRSCQQPPFPSTQSSTGNASVNDFLGNHWDGEEVESGHFLLLTVDDF